MPGAATFALRAIGISRSVQHAAGTSLLTSGRLGFFLPSRAVSAQMGLPGPLEGLQPPTLWQYFGDLTQTPRPSKHEDRVLQYLKQVADQLKLPHKQDAAGNIVIYRPGSGGGEGALPVIIQGHVDMVTEKNSDIVHDFHQDALKLQLAGDWLKACGTTLGADNGIGVAAALALLSQPKSVRLPPLEALFTVDEETGLTGAFDLDPSMLSGRTLLNLDTEDWGEIFIGCAGGGDTQITLPCTFEPLPQGLSPMRLTISGLLGGHSGLNIGEDRGNAVIMATQSVEALLKAVPAARLAAFQGGDKRNALAREASALVLVPSSSTEAAQQAVQQYASAAQSEYGSLEKALSIGLSPGPEATHVLTQQGQQQLLTLLLLLPHGVVKHSHTVPGLVETSTNLASVRCDQSASASQAGASIVCCTRSSLSSALEAVRDRIEKAAKLCGASVDREQAYPGWMPAPSSPVVQLTKQCLQSLIGHEPKVGAIHAGLECGIIGEKLPGVDMVSYGPTIKGAHSPDEAVLVSTVQPFWDLTLAILAKLADQR